MTDTTEAGATTAPAGGRKRRTDTELAEALLTTIRAMGSEWTTGRAATHLNGIHRQRARKALKALADAGHLVQHDRHGRRHWTLRTDS